MYCMKITLTCMYAMNFSNSPLQDLQSTYCCIETRLATVVMPQPIGGSSKKVLAGLPDWILLFQIPEIWVSESWLGFRNKY